MNVDIEYIKSHISYDENTGKFYRIKILNDKPNMTWRIGSEIGNTTGNGYIEISIGEQKWSAHKLAWLLCNGYYPDMLDHINGDKQDNRLCNLRLSNNLDNMRNRGKNKNNSSGYNGVYNSGKRYRARIKVKGKLINLGTFDTIEEAVEARRNANIVYNFSDEHGERESWDSKKK